MANDLEQSRLMEQAKLLIAKQAELRQFSRQMTRASLGLNALSVRERLLGRIQERQQQPTQPANPAREVTRNEQGQITEVQEQILTPAIVMPQPPPPQVGGIRGFISEWKMPLMSALALRLQERKGWLAQRINQGSQQESRSEQPGRQAQNDDKTFEEEVKEFEEQEALDRQQQISIEF